MHLPLFIAKRYLFAKKSHNVINIISLISAIGIGIGSMALIIILSVYNGFDTLVKSFYQEYQPNFIITPAQGKTFIADSLLISRIEQLGAYSFPIVEETVFLEYNSRQSIARIKGICEEYGSVSGVTTAVKEGGFKLFEGDVPHAVVGRALAAELRLRPRFVEAIELYFPDREANISMLNPMASLNNETLYAGGIVTLNNEFDANSLFVPLSVARELLDYAADEVTSLEIFITNDATPKEASVTDEASDADYSAKSTSAKSSEFVASKKITFGNSSEVEKALEKILNDYSTRLNSKNEALGKDTLSNNTLNKSSLSKNSSISFVIKDKYRQNETLYKMMRAEKFAVYLILFFVILIVSVNIFGSLSMLIIDKKYDMETYKSMGASEQLIKRIFVLQGWLISVIGAAIGIVIGLILCFIQQKFGLISMPGNYIISAYPVNIHISDIFITFFGVAIIGYLIALLPSKVKLL